ncbi:MAG: hypothetical protein JRI62_04800 [Deltaproteobacteria bacterium]|nr:hypothetical protein [Deltaproteobacteria bacterium]
MKNLTVCSSLCLILIIGLAGTGYVWSQDCTLEQMEGRTIIQLGSSSLCSPNEVDGCVGQSDPISDFPLIPSGIYDVTLESFDNHLSKPNQSQLNENYFLRLFDKNNDKIVDTNAIDDLPDGSNILTQTVNTNLFVGDAIGTIVAIHFCDESTSNNCAASSNSIEPVCVAFDLVEERITDGRMTGGGSVDGTDVRHGFEVHCDLSKPNNVEVNWSENRFHMDNLDSAFCTEDSNIDQAPPNAAFDTFEGTGTGRFNGDDGATINFVFVDAGEPGKGVDSAMITITDKDKNKVLEVSGLLDKGGNHQAH